MSVKINPRLLDVVEVADFLGTSGQKALGTVVAELGGPSGEVLIEVADELGVPRVLLSRPAEGLKIAWESASAAPPATDVPKAQRLYENGILYLQNGLLSRARELLAEAFSMDMGLARDLLNGTNSLAEKGGFDSAIFLYRLLLDLAPGYNLPRENLAITLLNRGIAFARQGAFAKAIEDFDASLMLSPVASTVEAVRKNAAAVYSNWGIVQGQAKSYRDAFRLLKRALELDPSEEIRKNLALTLIALFASGTEHPEPASKEDLFKQAMFMGLTLSECLNAYGATLAGLGSFTEARQALEDAARADPQNPVPRKNLALLSDRRGEATFAVGLVQVVARESQRLRVG